MIYMDNKNKNSPTLNTIKMIEKTLENMPNSVIKISELKKCYLNKSITTH